MKKVIAFLLIAVFSFVFVEVASSAPFKTGEKIVYEIEANGVYVGTQKMQVKKIETVNGKKTYHCVADTIIDPEIAKTYNYYLHDVIHTWMDTESFIPIKIRKDIHEGKWKNTITLDFYYKIRKIWFVDKKKKKEGKFISFKSKVFDILSLVYYLRAKDLNIGSTYKIEYIGHDKPKVAKFKVVRGPELDDVKTIKVYQVGVAEARAITITMTDDEKRIPVKITLEFDINYLSSDFFTLKIVGIIKEHNIY